MKKTKLNLLTNRENYQKIEKIFAGIRFFLYLQIIILLVMITFFFITLFNQNKQIDELLSQKTIFLTTLNTQNDKEAKLIYLQNKYQDLSLFLKDDARSLPYYNLLVSALSKSSESANLNFFSIAKDRSTAFTVSFNNLDQLLNFFRFVESDEFLKNFETVALKSFNAMSDEKTTQNYELSFTGKFIEIYENKN